MQVQSNPYSGCSQQKHREVNQVYRKPGTCAALKDMAREVTGSLPYLLVTYSHVSS